MNGARRLFLSSVRRSKFSVQSSTLFRSVPTPLRTLPSTTSKQTISSTLSRTTPKTKTGLPGVVPIDWRTPVCCGSSFCHPELAEGSQGRSVERRSFAAPKMTETGPGPPPACPPFTFSCLLPPVSCPLRSVRSGIGDNSGDLPGGAGILTNSAPPSAPTRCCFSFCHPELVEGSPMP